MGIKETQQLNELLAEQVKLFEQQEKALKGQLGVMQSLLATMRQINVETPGKNLENLNAAVKNAAESVEKLGSSQQTLKESNDAAKQAADAMDEMSKSAEKFGRKMLKLAPIVATIEGLGAGLQFSMNIMSGLINVSKGLIGSMFNLAASIISVPFKMLNGLMEMAAQGGGTELRQAIEDVRKEFGDLAQNEARAVMQSWRQLDHFGGRLAETNLSIWRTMGNMAETLKRVHEMATQLGPVFSSFVAEFRERKGVERLHAYQKGLGLTEEGFRAMGEEAARQGVSIQEMGRRITSVAFSMGEAFGINGKLISREIGKMMDDFEHFGNIGVQELAQVAVYARKLGVEVEKLTGVLDQFADFDKAAESVAQLSQAFGLQLDTLKLVQEQDPAANIERLRKAFFAAGRSVESMTRQERALLSSHTGLDQKTLSLVFSAEKQGMTYEDLQKQGENAQKQQLSQAEAMQKLSNSIERLVKSGSQLRGGFFDIFIQGFLKGIRWTREFWGLMRNLRISMRETRWAGIKVGQMFVKNFPGVRDVLKGIAELFDPRRFRTMLTGVTKAFRSFFEDMTKNPQVALPRLLDKLKETFLNWFDTSTPSGRRIIDGFKNFFKALAQIFAGLLKEAMKGATKAFRFLIDFLKNPESVLGGAREATGGVIGFISEILEPVWQTIKDQWPAFKAAFLDLVKTAWEKIKPPIINFLKDNWVYILGILFGPAIITGAFRGLSTALLSILIKGLGSALFGFEKKGGGLVGAAFSRLSRRSSTKGITSGGRTASALKGAIESAGSATEAARRTRVSASDIAKMALLALVITAGLIAIATAMVMLAQHIQEKGITTENIKNAAVVMIATGAIMFELAATVALLSVVGQAIQSQISGVLIGVAAIGIIGAAMALGAVGLIELFKDYREEDINKTVMIMGATAAFFMAAIAVTVGAGVIGAIISSTSGLAAIAVLAGLATLAAIMIGMAETARQIIDTVKSIRVTSADMLSLKAFIIVLNAMGNFAGQVSRIAAATAPSFSDLFVQGESTTKRLESVGTVIQTMGRQLRRTVQFIIEEARSLVGNEDLGNKVSLITSILQTIGTVANDLQPSNEFFRSTGWIENITGVDVTDRLQHLTKYVKTIVGALRTTITQVIRQFATLAEKAGFTAESLEAAKAIGAILESIGMIGRAMTVYISREYATTDPETLRQLAPQLGAVVSSMMSAIVGEGGQNIFSRMSNVIRMVVDSIKGLSPRQLSAVKTAIPIVQSAFEAVAGIATLLAGIGLSQAVQTDPAQTKQNIDQIIRVINAVTYGLGNNLQRIIRTLVNSFEGITSSQATNIKRGAEAVKMVFESIGSIADMTTRLQSISEAGGGGGLPSHAADMISTTLAVLLSVIAGSERRFGFVEFVGGIIPALQLISGNVGALSTTLPDFIETMRLTKGAVTAIDRVYSSEVFQRVSQVDEAVLTKTKDAVSAMVRNINDIGQALRGVRGFNINSELQTVNNKLNLGSSGRLEIAHHPVQFNVNWRITLDSEELEKALIEREGSVIQTKRDTVG